MNVRRTTLLIAIVLAVGTGWLTLTYLSSLRPANSEPRQVVVATQDIAARERITPQMFHVETRDAKTLQPDAISDPSRMAGALALITIPAGSQITASDVGTNVESALPVRLRPGMRAVSIPVDHVKGVSGLIQPGDRVDVIAVPPKDGDSPGKAVTIMRGIRVLAVGSTLEYASATPSPQDQGAPTVTLEVNPKQADLLTWADSDATIRLALRSPLEPIRSEPVEALVINSGDSAPAMLPPPGPVAPLTAPVAVAPVVAKPAANPVQVIIGDKIVDPSKAQ
ncbi:MAG TPA: Flp pilus assembly protein CpaB [Candidatus Tumulicola sp.]|jgi:pilus assembly protein CpaB